MDLHVKSCLPKLLADLENLLLWENFSFDVSYDNGHEEIRLKYENEK